MAIVTYLTVGALSALVGWRLFRGSHQLAADSPRCPSCRYDLTGHDLADDVACPECGSRSSRMAAMEQPRRAPRLHAVAGCVMIMLGVGACLHGASETRTRLQDEWYAYRPDFMVVSDLDHPDQQVQLRAALAVAERVSAGEFSESNRRAAADAVARHNATSSGPGFRGAVDLCMLELLAAGAFNKREAAAALGMLAEVNVVRSDRGVTTLGHAALPTTVQGRRLILRVRTFHRTHTDQLDAVHEVFVLGPRPYDDEWFPALPYTYDASSALNSEAGTFEVVIELFEVSREPAWPRDYTLIRYEGAAPPQAMQALEGARPRLLGSHVRRYDADH